jgi:hypothetical protein
LRFAVALAGAIALLALPALAAADTSPYPPGPFAPWDGSNPFNCQNQDVGTGTAYPDPNADPFCVEYDKTQQNITDLGLFDFTLQEPTRLAAAGNKCFYYQRDHWTGSVVQGEQPELWHWDGSYFIDRGLGVGGGNLANFRILGQPASPAAYFPIPPDFAPYVDQDGFGALVVLNLPIDPTCAAKVDTPEERAQIYGPGGPASQAAAGGLLGAAAPGAAKHRKRCKHRAHKRCKRRHR